jgi:uncharacterized membrane protein
MRLNVRIFVVVLLLTGVLSPSLVCADTYTFLYLEDGSPVVVARTNNHGVSVGSLGQNGFFLHEDGSVELFPIPSVGFSFPTVSDINDAGDVVGVHFGQSNTRLGFLRKKGVFTTIQVPGEGLTTPNGLNNGGTVVGGFFLAGQNRIHGFIFKNGVYTKVAIPGMRFVTFWDVNDAGDIVGEAFAEDTNEMSGFIYRNGTVIPLPAFPGADFSFYRGINNRGEVAGYAFTTSENYQFGKQDGFIIRDGQLKPFRILGSSVIVVNGINDKSEVTGAFAGNATDGEIPTQEGTSFIRRPR